MPSQTELSQPEGNRIEQDAFSEARHLLRNSSLTFLDPIYRPGRHCTIRIRVTGAEADRCRLELDLRAFERNSIDWSRFPLRVMWQNPERTVLGMGDSIQLSPPGYAEVDIRTAGESPVFTLRTPVSYASAALATERRRVAAPDEPGRLAAWAPYPRMPHYYFRKSEDGRLTAFYNDLDLTLKFRLDEGSPGSAVWWIVKDAAGRVVGQENLAPLQPSEDAWDSVKIPIQAPVGCSLYFELVPAEERG